MSKLRVLILTHTNLIPPEDIVDRDDPRLSDCRSEYDVKTALLQLGHEIRVVGIEDDITPIRRSIEEWKPHIAFNMMEAFADNGALDYYIVSYLDMVGLPYTGCNPRGMLLARDKSLSKKLLSYHRIRVPRFFVFPRGKKVNPRKVAKLPYPMIVKSTVEQGSVGIAQASYVSNPEELIERVGQLFTMAEGDAIAEQYIEGRELYVAVLGNTRLQVLPVRELVFDKLDDNMHRIATYNVKWNEKYRERWGIDYQFARNLPAGMTEKINALAKRVYRILDMNSYARLDLRLTNDGKLYVLEANPNAAISTEDDVAFSAERAGIMYDQLIQRILNLGLRYRREIRP
ncbi:MAG: ATP-grasp domain-containing protein [Gammaproteobacteria bacterium]|jgi:D-alanine-D-alanine ligase